MRSCLVIWEQFDPARLEEDDVMLSVQSPVRLMCLLGGERLQGSKCRWVQAVINSSLQEERFLRPFKEIMVHPTIKNHHLIPPLWTIFIKFAIFPFSEGVKKDACLAVLERILAKTGWPFSLDSELLMGQQLWRISECGLWTILALLDLSAAFNGIDR